MNDYNMTGPDVQVEEVKMRTVTGQREIPLEEGVPTTQPYEHDIYEALTGTNPYSIPGYRETTNWKPQYATGKKPDEKTKKRLISKFFSNTSRLGMHYDDLVIDNMRLIPADKGMLPKDQTVLMGDIFGNNNWKQKSDRDKSFYEKDYQIKREVLRRLAVQPELEDILDTLTNECIVYDSNYTYFLEPYMDPQELDLLDPNVRSKVEESINLNFKKFYKMLGWKTKAWDQFKRFLVEGALAFEIVYDSLEKPKRIIGIIPVDPATLTRKFENNKWYWVQFKGIQGRERKILDSNIIYIQYQETEALSRISYLERLIRPYNIYRIIEQAFIIWTVTNASYKMKFTIPVKGMTKAAASQRLGSAMNKYKEDIKFIGDSGELTINGQTNLPFHTDIFLPSTDEGSPEIEVLGGDGPELNDNEYLKFWRNQLYKISKVPISRFDAESGDTWFGSDASSVQRTEIDFGKFVHRLRNIFAQIIIKPLQLQLCLDIPEFEENRDFLEVISVQFKSNNLFEEMMELENMQKRVDAIQSMKDGMVDMDKDGNEIKFFSSEFLVAKYLHLSDADLKLNKKLKQKEIDELNLAGGDEEGDGFESLSNDELDRLILEANEEKQKRTKEKPKRPKVRKKTTDDPPKDTEEE